MFAHVVSCTVGLPILLEHQAKPMQHAPVWVVLDAAVGHMTSPTMLPTHISRTPRARPLRPTQEDMPAYAAKLMASPSVAVLHSLREQLAAGQSQAAAEVLSRVTKHLRACAPTRTARAPLLHREFWTPALAAAKHDAVSATHAARRDRDLASQAQAAWCRYRALVRRAKRAWERRLKAERLQQYLHNPRLLWQILWGKPKAPIPFDAHDATVHFQSVLEGDGPALAAPPSGLLPEEVAAARSLLLPLPTANRQLALQVLNAPLAQHEVEAAILALKPSRAADAQGLTAEALRARCDADSGVPADPRPLVLAPLLTDLLQGIFSGRLDMPPSLQVNMITPVYKGKGDRSVPPSYRPIVVGDLLGKVYESILDRRLAQIPALVPGARSESQCGFREGRGTLDGLFVFLHLVQRATAKRRPLYVVLVDFRMAFDVVDRALLLEQWRSMGISGVFLNALSRLYQHIRMQVQVNGETGPSFPTTRGTKQGSILSPQLFGFFIETICPLLEAHCPGAGPLIGLSNVPNLLYADDLTLFAESEKDMDALLGALDLFCHLMRMVVNLDKTVALVFASRRHAPAPVFSYRGTHIQIVPKAKYLGLKFDSTKGIAEPPPLETAEARMRTLLHRCRQLHMDTPGLACRLFDALIWPMLCYGAQIWGPALARHQVHSLDPKGNPYDALHMKFLRAVGGLPKSSHKASVLAEFGRIPLIHRVVRDALLSGRAPVSCRQGACAGQQWRTAFSCGSSTAELLAGLVTSSHACKRQELSLQLS